MWHTGSDANCDTSAVTNSDTSAVANPYAHPNTAAAG